MPPSAIDFRTNGMKMLTSNEDAHVNKVSIFIGGEHLQPMKGAEGCDEARQAITAAAGCG
jgi:hypothetical protein